MGPSLKEIAALLNESLDLTGRERLDGLKAIEVIASDWKSILDPAEKLLSIANEATDRATKFAPLLPAITALIHDATKWL